MHRFKLTIAYDGTHFGGWQVQANAPSIQVLIEQALQTALRISTPIVGASRTDAGVHAAAQVAHFDAAPAIDTYRLHASLNGLLPPDIRILHIQQVAPDFHARYSALSKEYHYHIHLNRVLDPFKRLYSHHVLAPLDLSLLQEAASVFLGEHDFTSFANEAYEGSAAKNPIRTLQRLDLVLEEGGLRLEFEGKSFLYKMVRNITGTLLDIARGKIPLTGLPEIFAAKDRQKAGPAAPAQGLFLVKIKY